MAEVQTILDTLARVPERAVSGTEDLHAQLHASERPFIVRGLAEDWPLVQAGKQSGKAARDYLASKSRERPFVVSVGRPGGDGRLFYDDAMHMNFRMANAKLPEVFTQIDREEGQADAHTIYLASVDMHNFFVGLHEENQVDMGERQCLASIWMGTPTRIAAHNDFPDNLAICAVGKRRFTLFPREQFRNLYLGPIDHTPAGRAISMVDFHAPDFERFPKFREALGHALVAELEPGDALYIPSMWWHHVEGLSPFNVLVNYWWRESPRWTGQPQHALNLAMMAIRDLPEDEKRHWRDMFDYYVFQNSDEAVAHIPEQARTVLGPLTPELASKMRTFLLRALSQ